MGRIGIATNCRRTAARLTSSGNRVDGCQGPRPSPTDQLRVWSCHTLMAGRTSRRSRCGWWRFCREPPPHSAGRPVSPRRRGAGRARYRAILAQLPAPPRGETFGDKHPALVSEWDEERNAPLTPWMFSPGSGLRVAWVCAKGHRWRAESGREPLVVGVGSWAREGNGEARLSGPHQTAREFG